MAIGSSGGSAGRVMGNGLVFWDPSFVVFPISASSSDRTFGTFSLVHVSQTPQMFQSMFEIALTKLAKKYSESGIHSKFLELEE